ncbi:MAG: NUDIX domain-containing protein [Anaerolineaceae bacterium]|nr:MAG: NUDIX domain-containing protein [Anaerolineaceae bacterium]
MTYQPDSTTAIVQRVRAILLARQRGEPRLLFIKRLKPQTPPYWVAPGGGVEDTDESLYQTLSRELMEELGATARVLRPAFVLRHEKGGKNLEEHFFICRLTSFDLRLRNGPEFSRPERGLYLPDFLPLQPESLDAVYIKTEELHDWLKANLGLLRRLGA